MLIPVEHNLSRISLFKGIHIIIFVAGYLFSIISPLTKPEDFNVVKDNKDFKHGNCVICVS